MTTPPQVPAALCGVFIGAKVVADDAKTAIGRVERADTEGALVWYVDRPAVTRPVRRLHLLLDSPLAMCHAARWLAQRRGHPPVSTAPEWSVEWDSDGVLCWRLRSGDEADWFPTVDTDLTDAEALAAACLAVGGAS